MRLILLNPTIIDGKSNEPIKGCSIIIENNRISKISKSPTRTETEGANVIDLQGFFAIPGLFDTHTHLVSPLSDVFHANETTVARYIRAGKECMDGLSVGITSVRAVGTHNYLDLAWKRSFANNMFHGPRIFASGYALTTTAGHAVEKEITYASDGGPGFRKIIREQLKEGVDHLKLLMSGGCFGDRWDSPTDTHFLSDEIESVFGIAQQRGYKVAVHAGSPESTKLAVKAGAHSIEHGYSLDEESVDLMVRNNTYYVPTLLITHMTNEAALTPYHKNYITQWPLPNNLLERANTHRAAHSSAFKMALEAGVKIAAGSDAGPLRDAAILEIELLVQNGMSPMNAIKAATLISATVCEADKELGSIEEGKYADLVILRKNPAEAIGNIRSVYQVYKNGKLEINENQ